MNPYETIPFINKIGQVIQPGSKIIVVTGGRGSSIHTRLGTYLGRRTTKDWRGKDQIETVVEVQDTKGVWVDAAGNVCGWEEGVTREKRPYLRKATLWLNRIFAIA